MAKTRATNTPARELTQVDTSKRGWRKRFIAALRDSANVRWACMQAGVTRQAAYQYREDHEKFKAEWDEALEDACDILEGRAWQRSETSDPLLIFLLKAHRPGKYRERSELTGLNGGPIETKNVSELSDDERIARVAAIFERARQARDRQAASANDTT